ncbi:MAG: glycosyltransferase family A protein [Dehalococcoidales bacterium]|nr:glycosyltransferase family A protein [Dehalococcoidales bacterium]
MQASVVILANRRGGRLRWTLRSAIQQTLPADAYEIIVIEGGLDSLLLARSERDRAGEDVWQMVSGEAERCPAKIRYLYQPQCTAEDVQDAGRRAARGDVVVFLHVGEVADPDWLYNVLEASGKSATAGSRRGAAKARGATAPATDALQKADVPNILRTPWGEQLVQ